MTAVRTPGHRRERVRSGHAGELVLVATDDLELRRLLCEKLDVHAYRAVLTDSSSRIEDLVVQIRPVVILLDLDGHADGLGILARIRSRAETPMILLASRVTEADMVAALDAGADDYVAKPFGWNELLARIRVALRRGRVP